MLQLVGRRESNAAANWYTRGKERVVYKQMVYQVSPHVTTLKKCSTLKGVCCLREHVSAGTAALPTGAYVLCKKWKQTGRIGRINEGKPHQIVQQRLYSCALNCWAGQPIRAISVTDDPKPEQQWGTHPKDLNYRHFRDVPPQPEFKIPSDGFSFLFQVTSVGARNAETWSEPQ